MLTIVEASLLL